LQKQNFLPANFSEKDFQTALLRIYQKPVQDELQTLCEFLIEFDEQIILWRFRHVQMVERMIGMKHGTGGSLGVPYLETTLKRKFFPELWEARTQMGV
ncbi:tryptophan 2,3-dioxygenase, partial [bacterium]|nr:tryptophan 2,3-dioxygenase [bacterium]